MPTVVTDQSLEAAVKTGVVIVDLWATWCAPCRILTPMLVELEQEQGFTLATLDVEANHAVPAQYQVQSIPTLLVFKDGKAIEKITGAYPKAKLRAHFAQLMGADHGGK